MRCKKHLSDLSSIAGVCATCLREKLFLLIEAQARLQQAQEQRRNSNANPPPIVFPHSVSPYASRRESDDTATWQPSRHGFTDQRFHASPQVGPSGELISGNEYTKKKNKNKNKNSGFSLVYRMFRSKSGNLDSDSESRMSNSDYQCDTTPSSSPSWFSTIIAGRRGKKNRSLSLDEATIGVRQRAARNCDRGMSPARYSDGENEEDFHGGCSGQSSPGWKQTPRRTPASRPCQRSGVKGGHSRNASGMTFCLSPLVWASPNQRWNQKGMAAEMVYPGENRSPAKSRLSFCKNRSRKLADLGRFHHNH